MKIIFDSEEQKSDFVNYHCCPGNLGYDELDDDECASKSCSKCWAESGIEMEVIYD